MPVTAAIVALVCAAVGWYYLFFSQSAARMKAFEPEPTNAVRRRLRRINGAAMFLLAVGFYAGFASVDSHKTPRAFVIVWLCVFALLGVVVILVGVDLRMTTRVRKRKNP